MDLKSVMGLEASHEEYANIVTDCDIIINPNRVTVHGTWWDKISTLDNYYSEQYKHFFKERNMIGDVALLETKILGITFNDKRGSADHSIAYTAGDTDGQYIIFPVYIEVKPYCSVKLTEHFYSDAQKRVHRIVYVLREGATLELERHFHDTDNTCVQIVENEIIQHPLSKLKIFTVAENQHYLQDLYYVTAYTDTTTDIKGRYSAEDDEAVHVITDIDHLGKNCSSNVDVKSVTDDVSKFTFSGNLIVRKEAEGANAHLQNKNLQVVDTTTVITEPKLDISTKEIACTHGCTVSSIDDEQRYLLNTRGIDDNTAKQLLIEAFLNG